jgi:hypothetical protein
VTELARVALRGDAQRGRHPRARLAAPADDRAALQVGRHVEGLVGDPRRPALLDEVADRVGDLCRAQIVARAVALAADHVGEARVAHGLARAEVALQRREHLGADLLGQLIQLPAKRLGDAARARELLGRHREREAQLQVDGIARVPQHAERQRRAHREP